MHKVRESGLDDLIEADSAGTGFWHVGEAPHRGTQRLLRERGIAYTHAARQVISHDIDAFDLILTMDDDNYANVEAMGTGSAKLFRLLDFAPSSGLTEVPDPWYTGNFHQTYELVAEAADGVIAYIKKHWDL